VHLTPFHEDSITIETEPMETMLPQASPRRKIGIKKKLTPKKLQVAAASPSNPTSPASIPEARRSSSCNERCLLNVLLVMWFWKNTCYVMA